MHDPGTDLVPSDYFEHTLYFARSLAAMAGLLFFGRGCPFFAPDVIQTTAGLLQYVLQFHFPWKVN